MRPGTCGNNTDPMRILAIVAALLAALATPSSATAQAALLEPGGGYPIGLRTLHLTDQTRAEQWQPGQRRELMVSLWYPALPMGRPGRYMTPAESAATVEGL